MVGRYILRLVFPGDPGCVPDTVRPERPLPTAAAPELLSQLLYRLLGDANHVVRMGCIRCMERVLSTATTPPTPLHILGHTVHLVCVSNGVIPELVESEELFPTARFESAGHRKTLIAADVLDMDLQVCSCEVRLFIEVLNCTWPILGCVVTCVV